jgi:hypothetical protein
MSRNTTLKCDICRKETEHIAAKLFYTPVINGLSKAVHSNYSHHCDVGICCKDKVLSLFNFSRRQTAEQYQAARKKQTV